MTHPIDPAALPEAPRKNFFARHKVLTVVGGIVALIIIISAANSGGSKTPAESAPGSSASASEGSSPDAEPAEDKPAEQKPAIPGLGVAVKDKNFEFTAISIDKAGSSVGGEYLNATAQGEFYRVNMRISNASDKSQTFTVNSLTIVDEKGRKFDADSSATIYDAPDSGTWIAQINPGNAVEGGIIFDLPADAVPAELIVKGSMLSGGTSINLRG